jgi:hypothetical protein
MTVGQGKSRFTQADRKQTFLLPLEVRARYERTLEGVGSTAMFGSALLYQVV